MMETERALLYQILMARSHPRFLYRIPLKYLLADTPLYVKRVLNQIFFFKPLGIGGKRNGVTDFFVVLAVANINDVLIVSVGHENSANPHQIQRQTVFRDGLLSDPSSYFSM